MEPQQKLTDLHSRLSFYNPRDKPLKKQLLKWIGNKQRFAHEIINYFPLKKSGRLLCEVDFPNDLFDREVFVNCGRSMLRRFQREGDTLEDEVVSDRLLLTY